MVRSLRVLQLIMSLFVKLPRAPESPQHLHEAPITCPFVTFTGWSCTLCVVLSSETIRETSARCTIGSATAAGIGCNQNAAIRDAAEPGQRSRQNPIQAA